MKKTLLVLGMLCLAVPAWADFVKVQDGGEFARLTEGRALTRMGIKVTVTPAGEIQGRAFGQPVTGEWSWQNGYFCRDLAWGDTEFPYNCQEVTRRGNALRFTSDQGSGRSAELTLR